MFRGYRADQVLVGGYERSEMWGEIYDEQKDYVFHPVDFEEYF